MSKVLVNGKSQFEVIDSSGGNRLLRRISDSEIIIAKGWNGESWLCGEYYGQKLDKARSDWENEYSKVGSFGYGVVNKRIEKNDNLEIKIKQKNLDNGGKDFGYEI